ncbi:hypothetical protein EV379_2253 [Microterricola gilva]|uniref:Bacterial Ig domain-containing protein n=1 Tax=Microterricola gilva TaxID=393267 RepID=A0A4Q8AMV5_9MICO|nr:hypothetical protein EV379_2253 [Microterricola gilva]
MITSALAAGAIAFAGLLAAPAAHATPNPSPTTSVSAAVRAAALTLPTATGSAAPGMVAGWINIYDPTPANQVRGYLTVTAPPGTTFDRVSVNMSSITIDYSDDRRTATVSISSYGGGAGTIQIKLLIPGSAKPLDEFPGGTVSITSEAAGGSLLASGAFSATASWPRAFSTPENSELNQSSAFTGVGKPGAAVLIKNEHGDVIATTTVQADGTWSASLAHPFPDGTFTATAVVENVTLPAKHFTMKNTFQILTPVAGSVLEPNQVFTGVGEPGSTVAITDGKGNVVAEATVSPDGTWSATQTGTLPSGPSELFLTSTSVGGVSETTPQGTFVTTDETPVDTPVLDTTIAGGIAMAALAAAGTLLLSRRRSAALRG